MTGRPVFTIALVLAVLGTGCGNKNSAQQNTGNAQASLPQNGGMPSGAPPFQSMGMGDATGPLDDNAVPLRATGLNSAEELNRALARLDDPSLKKDFETAFRSSFSAKKAQRNYPEAVQLAQKVTGAKPDFAPAYRVLGYALFNTGEQSQALSAYEKAVQIDPNYGEAHYALAFMYAMGDLATGKVHFKKAMELGIPDERDLKSRFYPD